MGRTEGTPENGLLTAGEIAAYLLDNCRSLRQFDVYMFGSTLNGIGEDIDILVVGIGDSFCQVKQELRAAGERLPLHILYMQLSEARYTDFVRREGCMPLDQL